MDLHNRNLSNDLLWHATLCPVCPALICWHEKENQHRCDLTHSLRILGWWNIQSFPPSFCRDPFLTDCFQITTDLQYQTSGPETPRKGRLSGRLRRIFVPMRCELLLKKTLTHQKGNLCGEKKKYKELLQWSFKPASTPHSCLSYWNTSPRQTYYSASESTSKASAVMKLLTRWE